METDPRPNSLLATLATAFWASGAFSLAFFPGNELGFVSASLLALAVVMWNIAAIRQWREFSWESRRRLARFYQREVKL